jgi:hypothetical protein
VGKIGVKYLLLYLFDDLPTAEIDRILDLEFRERDYLQQRVIYHCERFETGWDTWKLHHDYFGIGIDTNLGLVGDKLTSFLSQLSESDLELYELVKSGSSVEKSKGKYQNGRYVLPLAIKNQWRSILKLAKKIRNYKVNLDS